MKKNPGRKASRLRERGTNRKPGDLNRANTHRMRSQMHMTRDPKVKSGH